MDVRASLLEIVSSHSSASSAGPIDDVPLGEQGLGLDSIAIAEVLLECETRFGMGFVRLLDGTPLTVRRLIEHVRLTSQP